MRFISADDVDDIISYRAYLTTIITRICLDYLKSARVQREQYFGPWLPEPLETADEPSVVIQSKRDNYAGLSDAAGKAAGGTGRCLLPGL
ncbi:MAG: hypothetical protein R2911_19915 [Caldilineaceae bacterium]